MTLTAIIPDIIAVAKCAPTPTVSGDGPSVPVDSEAIERVQQRFGLRCDGLDSLPNTRAALQTLLSEMSEGDIRRLHALMYAGRPEKDDATSIKKHFESSTETKAGLTRTIVEKAPSLAYYISEALKLAERDGLDIDNF